MEIQVSKEAQEKLVPYKNEGIRFLIDLDDGVGEFSKFGVCSLDTHFRILVVNKKGELPDYSEVLESNDGPFYIKDYTKHYFGQKPQLTVNERFCNLVLSTENGLVDGNVEILDKRDQA